MYQQAQAAQQAAQNAQNAQGNAGSSTQEEDDNVVDADYKVVDDEEQDKK